MLHHDGPAFALWLHLCPPWKLFRQDSTLCLLHGVAPWHCPWLPST